MIELPTNTAIRVAIYVAALAACTGEAVAQSELFPRHQGSAIVSNPYCQAVSSSSAVNRLPPVRSGVSFERLPVVGWPSEDQLRSAEVAIQVWPQESNRREATWRRNPMPLASGNTRPAEVQTFAAVNLATPTYQAMPSGDRAVPAVNHNIWKPRLTQSSYVPLDARVYQGRATMQQFAPAVPSWSSATRSNAQFLQPARIQTHRRAPSLPTGPTGSQHDVVKASQPQTPLHRPFGMAVLPPQGSAP